MKKKGDAICSTRNINYFRRMRESIEEELTSVICADYERDSCDNVRVPTVSDREVRGSIIVPMKQIFDKVLT